jgi:hypothetical protein
VEVSDITFEAAAALSENLAVFSLVSERITTVHAVCILSLTLQRRGRFS